MHVFSYVCVYGAFKDSAKKMVFKEAREEIVSSEALVEGSDVIQSCESC